MSKPSERRNDKFWKMKFILNFEDSIFLTIANLTIFLQCLKRKWAKNTKNVKYWKCKNIRIVLIICIAWFRTRELWVVRPSQGQLWSSSHRCCAFGHPAAEVLLRTQSGPPPSHCRQTSFCMCGQSAWGHTSWRVLELLWRSSSHHISAESGCGLDHLERRLRCSWLHRWRDHIFKIERHDVRLTKFGTLFQFPRFKNSNKYWNNSV